MSKLSGKTKAKARKDERKKQARSKAKYIASLQERIFKWDAPELKVLCEPVQAKEDISNHVNDLKKVLSSTKNGIGLSSNQIGGNKRVFVIRTNEGVLVTFINPEIVEESEVKVPGREGCLSYPGTYTVVDRPWKLVLRYQNEKMIEQRKEFMGLFAACICHELEHLLGDEACQVGKYWASMKQFSKQS